MLCSHGVGTSHLEQAPSSKPNPSRTSNRNGTLPSRIALTPLTLPHIIAPPAVTRPCYVGLNAAIPRVSRPNFYYLTSLRPTKAPMPKERSPFGGRHPWIFMLAVPGRRAGDRQIRLPALFGRIQSSKRRRRRAYAPAWFGSSLVHGRTGIPI